jgi:hypothetical protein
LRPVLTIKILKVRNIGLSRSKTGAAKYQTEITECVKNESRGQIAVSLFAPEERFGPINN